MTPAKLPTPGVGNRLIRLAEDTSFDERRSAVEHLLSRGGVTDESEAVDLLLLVIDPGDAGGRIAD